MCIIIREISMSPLCRKRVLLTTILAPSLELHAENCSEWEFCQFRMVEILISFQHNNKPRGLRELRIPFLNGFYKHSLEAKILLASNNTRLMPETPLLQKKLL